MAPEDKKEAARARNLRVKYGITIAEYEGLLALQNGICALCKNPPKTKRLAVEHDHKSGAIRGLACFYCNKRIIGRATIDRTKALLNYLENPTADQFFGMKKLVPPKLKKKRKR